MTDRRQTNQPRVPDDGLEALDSLPRDIESKIWGRQDRRQAEELLAAFLESDFDCIRAPIDKAHLSALKSAYRGSAFAGELRIDAYRGYCQIYKAGAASRLRDADISEDGEIYPIEYGMEMLSALGWAACECPPPPQTREKRRDVIEKAISQDNAIQIAEPDETERKRLYSALFSYQKRHPEHDIRVSMHGDLIMISFQRTGKREDGRQGG